MQTPINVRAVLIGLVAFPVFYAAGSFLLNLLIDRPSESRVFWLWIAPIFAGVLWLLPGFITGYMAKRSPLLHGSVLGFGSAFATLIILGVLELVISFSQSVPIPLVVGFLVPVFIGSCIGAFIGHFVATRRKAP